MAPEDLLAAHVRDELGRQPNTLNPLLQRVARHNARITVVALDSEAEDYEGTVR
jgi:hypothetical protein